MRILRLQKHKSGGGQDTQATVSSPPPFIADYFTSKTGSWAFFNKICQNDLTRYCHKGIINLLFSKLKKLKMGGGQDAQATVSSPPGVKIIRAGVKIPREILTPGGQAARGYLDPRGSSCPGVKINRYTGWNMAVNSVRHSFLCNVNITVWSHCRVDRKRCSNNEIHVQIMKFTRCLNMVFT